MQMAELYKNVYIMMERSWCPQKIRSIGTMRTVRFDGLIMGKVAAAAMEVHIIKKRTKIAWVKVLPLSQFAFLDWGSSYEASLLGTAKFKGI